MAEKNITSKQRAYLRSLAADIEPIFQIGKGGLTPEITEAVLDALKKRELVKLSVLKNCDDDIKEVGITLAERTNSVLVHVMGRKIVLYKADPKNPKIILPVHREVKDKKSREM